MYDWANSAYATVITAAVLPPFFFSYYTTGLNPRLSTPLYAALAALAMFLAALLSPMLGALADHRRALKKFLAAFTALGALATACLSAVGRGQWHAAALLTVLGGIGAGCTEVFYQALLPHIAAEEDVDRVSAAGYALGYVGGGLLLAINVVWMLWPAAFGMRDVETATRYSLLSVGVWWGVFSLPLFLRVPEPRRACGAAAAEAGSAVRTAFARLARTFREIRQYRDLLLFLLAFWLYNDGIGTIIKMATLYGASLGLEFRHLVMALLLTQFVCVPFSFLFGALAGRIGVKNGIHLALATYALIAGLGFLMTRTWHFYALAAMVGTVQGGAQALSRSLFARMVPKDRSGEFFGFFSVSSKFAAIMGPALFAVVTYLSGSGRLAILSLVLFFVGGMALLSLVHVERGEAQAGFPLRQPAGAGGEGPTCLGPAIPG